MNKELKEELAMLALSGYVVPDYIDTNSNESIIIWAINHNHIKLIKVLLKCGVDINKKSNVGWTPLSWADFTDHTEIAEILRNSQTHE